MTNPLHDSRLRMSAVERQLDRAIKRAVKAHAELEAARQHLQESWDSCSDTESREIVLMDNGLKYDHTADNSDDLFRGLGC